MTDRRIHAETDQMEIVRYDRSGKWYLEPKGNLSPRQQVTVKDAAKYAIQMCRGDSSTIYLGLRGGRVFDRLVQR